MKSATMIISTLVFAILGLLLPSTSASPVKFAGPPFDHAPHPLDWWRCSHSKINMDNIGDMKAWTREFKLCMAAISQLPLHDDDEMLVKDLLGGVSDLNIFYGELDEGHFNAESDKPDGNTRMGLETMFEAKELAGYIAGRLHDMDPEPMFYRWGEHVGPMRTDIEGLLRRNDTGWETKLNREEEEKKAALQAAMRQAHGDV